MAFEVIVKEASKMVSTQAEVDAVVADIQKAFGVETTIVVNEVKATYDGKTAEAKAVGTVSAQFKVYPVKAEVAEEIIK